MRDVWRTLNEIAECNVALGETVFVIIDECETWFFNDMGDWQDNLLHPDNR